jgi:glucokinase
MPESSSQTQHLVGVDLGGTKILGGVFNSQFDCLGRAKVSTKPERGPSAVIERIARCVHETVDESNLAFRDVRGVGVGAPGAVNPQSGEVLFAPNLGWRDVSLRNELEKLLGVPVFVENDCNIATLGVYEVELKRKPRHVFGIFLGTGIGGGLIVDGKPYSGFNFTAGEIGHMTLEVGGAECNCGNRGCFEALASRTAIFRKIKTAIQAGQPTMLTSMLGPDLKDLRSRHLRKAIHRGDPFVERIIEEAAEYTGIAVGNIINLFNPEVVVLGGGVINALGDEMLAIIIETAQDYALAGTGRGIEIMASKIGDDAGIVGGAALVQQHLS